MSFHHVKNAYLEPLHLDLRLDGPHPVVLLLQLQFSHRLHYRHPLHLLRQDLVVDVVLWILLGRVHLAHGDRGSLRLLLLQDGRRQYSIAKTTPSLAAHLD